MLGIATFGAGLRGALISAFNLPSVVSVALIGAELLLGMRLAQRVDRHAADQQSGASVPFLIALMLSYTLAALLVVLATPWISTPFILFLLVMGGILVVLMTPEQGSDPVVSNSQG